MPTPLARTQRVLSISSVLLSGKRPRRRKLPKQTLPRLVSQDYARELIAIINKTREALEPLYRELPGLLERAERDRSRQDAGEGPRARALIELARQQLANAVKPTDIERLAGKFAERTQSWQRMQFAKQTKAAFGVDILSTDPRLPAIVEGFVSENVSLISDLPRKLLTDVEGVVTRGLTSGKLNSDIAKELEQRLNVSKSRAKLIARDQVGKLYGQVNASRQKSLGVSRFVWRTVGDERVRDEHSSLDGKIFSYDDPPSEGLPGEPINCRCYAEPVLSDLLEEAS